MVKRLMLTVIGCKFMKHLYFTANILLCMNFIPDSKAQDKATDSGLEKLYKYADSTTTDVLQMDAQNLVKLNLDEVAKLSERLKTSPKLDKRWKICSSTASMQQTSYRDTYEQRQ